MSHVPTLREKSLNKDRSVANIAPNNYVTVTEYIKFIQLWVQENIHPNTPELIHVIVLTSIAAGESGYLRGQGRDLLQAFLLSAL